MEDDKLAVLISDLEIVHMKMRNILEKNELSASNLSDMNESYSLISKCMDLLYEEEVRNEISRFSKLDE